MSASVWVVSSYYNPARYRRRKYNFDIFRQQIGLPLLVVEMSTADSFELSADDADIIVRVSNGGELWQKERLLNIAIARLPPEAEIVAWVDCDVIFGDAGWHQQLDERTRDGALVQCFSDLLDLPETWKPSVDRLDFDCTPTGYSIVEIMKNEPDAEDFVPNTTRGFRHSLCGLAWACRRDHILKYGLYDAMIVGSGDRALAFAAVGRFEEAIQATKMTRRRAAHYLPWAKSFHAASNGVANIPGRLFHLWHGQISDRRYLERHQILGKMKFDPTKDLAKNDDGAWIWTAGASEEVKQFLREYFANRAEDGPMAGNVQA
jgi:hypothetical protein